MRRNVCAKQFNFENVAAKISRLHSCTVLRDELHLADFCDVDETARSYYRRSFAIHF